MIFRKIHELISRKPSITQGFSISQCRWNICFMYISLSIYINTNRFQNTCAACIHFSINIARHVAFSLLSRMPMMHQKNHEVNHIFHFPNMVWSKYWNNSICKYEENSVVVRLELETCKRLYVKIRIIFEILLGNQYSSSPMRSGIR